MSQSKGFLGGLIAKIILILIAVGFIVSSIVGTGFLGSDQSLPPDVVLQVGSERLTRDMISRAIRFDQGLSAQNVQNNLINQMVLSQAYNNFGGVDPNFLSIQAEVTQNPLFFENGQFSNAIYLQRLQQGGYTPDQYVDEQVSRQIKMIVLRNGLIDSAFVLPSDIEVLAQIINQKRDVQTATLTLSDWVDPEQITVTEEDARAYYDTHLDDYLQGEVYKLAYVTLARNDFNHVLPASSITESQIKNYYDTHQDQFTTSARYNYHVIVVNDKKDADEVIQKLKGGANFDTVAETESLRPELLDLGWFTQEEVDTNFPHFSHLKRIGDYSYSDQDGNHYIVELHDYEPAQTYATAKEAIKKELIAEAATEAYIKELTQLEAITPSNFGSLEAFVNATSMKLPIRHSGFNTDGETIFNTPQIIEVLADGTLFPTGSSSAPLSPLIYANQGDSVYVIQVTDFIPARTLAFDDVKEEIMTELKQDKVEQTFAQKVESIIESLNNGETVEGVDFSEEYQLNHQSRDPNPMVVNIAYHLIPNINVYGGFLSTAESATLVKLDAVHDENVSDEEIQNIMSSFESYFKNNVISGMFEYVEQNNQILQAQ